VAHGVPLDGGATPCEGINCCCTFRLGGLLASTYAPVSIMAEFSFTEPE